MNTRLQADNHLLFKYEVLKARLGVRDFFLKNTIKEVYENIGQVLSVVRMQLAVLDINQPNEDSKTQPSHLVGQSIKDLRAMCKSFYPDEEILKDKGFAEALKETVSILYNDSNLVLKVKEIIDDIQPDLKLIVFKILQEILISTKENGGKFLGLAITQTKRNEVKFLIRCLIESPEKLESRNRNEGELTLQQRAQLIKGRLKITCTEAGITHIILVSPLNYFYE